MLFNVMLLKYEVIFGNCLVVVEDFLEGVEVVCILLLLEVRDIVERCLWDEFVMVNVFFLVKDLKFCVGFICGMFNKFWNMFVRY